MKKFTEEEINKKIQTGIPEHQDKNPVPTGDNPNEYLQAEELNKIVKTIDENTLVIKDLMTNSNELEKNKLNIPEEEGDPDVFKYLVGVNEQGESLKLPVDGMGSVDTVNNIEPDENKNINIGLDEVLKVGNSSKDSLDYELTVGTKEIKLDHPLVKSTYTSSGVDTVNNRELTAQNFMKRTTLNYQGLYFGTLTEGLSRNGVFLTLDPVIRNVNNGGPNTSSTFTQLLQPKDGTIALLSDINNENFANTNLVVTENRKHTGTGSVEFGMPLVFSNASQKFSALPDKSADATFNAILGLDSTGNLGKLTALGNVLESGLKNVSAEQALRIGQLLNGGIGSAKAMSVNLISPTVIDNTENANNYVVLRGSNLNLNTTSYSIQILDKTTNKVITTIPSSQIQIYTDGLQLIFYYNFYGYSKGNYIVKIVSGSKVYITTLDFQVVDSIDYLNTSEITWESVYDSNYTPSSKDIFEGGSISANISTGITGNLLALKSSELFKSGEDFGLEFSISFTSSAQNIGNTSALFIGIGYSDNNLNLVNSSLAYTKITKDGWNTSYYNQLTGVTTAVNNVEYTVTLVKTSNIIKIVIGSIITTITLSNNKGYSLYMLFPGLGTSYINTVSISKAYKIN